MLEGECNIVLSLAIGGGGFPLNKSLDQKKTPAQFHTLFLAQPKEEEISTTEEKNLERLRLTNKKEEDPVVSKDASDVGTRKKLKISKERLTLLEDSFRVHNTLSPVQKQDLARRLNLQPRQVEVWFQNRRARTKVKQTEADYEFLKEYCERLTNENRRLERELMELRSAKPGSQLYVDLRKAGRLRMCSSCDKMVNDEEKRSLSHE